VNKQRTPVLTRILTRTRVREIGRYRPRPYFVTTLYLDLDPAALFGRRSSPLKALVREAKARLEGVELTRKQRQSIEEDMTTLERIARDAPVRGGKAVCAFVCSGADHEQVVSLPHRVKSRVVIDRTPFVRPLEAMLDEHPRCLIVLSDRARARFLAAHLGRAAEIGRFESEVPAQVREGGYQGKAERKIERHIEDHVMRHHKQVAETARELLDSEDYDLVILGGPVEAVSGVKDELNPVVARSVAGEVDVELDAPEDEVMSACTRLLDDLQARTDQQLVERLIEAADSGGTGVNGMAAVLGALRRGAIAELLVAEDHMEEGTECTGCGFLSVEDMPCPACGSEKSRKVVDMVTELIDRATDSGAKVHHIARPPALSRLLELGGVGALLRFRLV